MKDICKTADCDFVYPVLEGDSIGNSLSSINYNFRQIDTQLCNVESDVNFKWLPTYTTFAENSGNWMSAITTFQANSACWQQTRTTVNQMSSFWLKPITLVYPYPFTGVDITSVRQWLVLNFPVHVGNCFNYIVGQDLYVFCPSYYTINRQVSNTQSIAKKTVSFTTMCLDDDRDAPSYFTTSTKSVDCGSATLSVNLPDQFVGSFVGIKFSVIIDGTGAIVWSSGTKISD